MPESITTLPETGGDEPEAGIGASRMGEQLGCRVHRDGRGRGERNGKAAGAEAAKGSGAVSRHQDKFESKD